MLSAECRITEIDEGDLTIVRNALDPDLLANLQIETPRFLLSNSHNGLKCKRGPSSPGWVVSLFWSATPDFSGLGYPALSKLMDITNEPHGQSFAINYQGPFATQPFHADMYKPGTVQTVQLTDGGAFDFVPERSSGQEELTDFCEIKVGAGDIVKQHRPSRRHRGRNRSDQPRINIGRY